MTTTLSLLPLLVRLALPLDDAAALPAHASESGEAWVVVHAGSTWVCWSAELDADACFRRVELEPRPPHAAPAFVPDEEIELGTPLALLDVTAGDPTLGIDVRFGFEAGRLWIGVDELGVWVVEPGQRQARWLDSPSSGVPLVRPSRVDCGPRGLVPALSEGRLAWISAPRCPSSAVPSGCLRPRPRVRKPSSVSIDLRLSLARSEAWSLLPGVPDLALPSHFRQSAGLELALVLELGFDPAAAWRLARARDELIARDRRRRIPAVDDHPLAAAERAALHAIACTEGA